MIFKVTLFTPLQLTPSEEAFLRNYAGVVHSQMSQLPQHNIDQGKAVTHARMHTHTQFKGAVILAEAFFIRKYLIV